MTITDEYVGRSGNWVSLTGGATISPRGGAAPPVLGTGLLWNDTILTEWRRRWTARDMYWNEGDVSTNSPGDGSRIDTGASAFHNGVTEPWQPPDKIYQYDGDVATSGREAGLNMRDAAFRCLMTENATEIATLKAHLLSEIRQPWMDVNNPDWWDTSTEAFYDIYPLFSIAGGLWVRMVFTYAVLDYLGEWTAPEKTEVQGVMEACADLCIENYQHSGYLDLFVDRDAGTITSFANDGTNRQDAYQGGPRIPRIGYYVNNRRGSMIGLTGMVGAMWGNTTIIDTSFKMVRDWVRFGVSPDGAISEFERENADPNTGWRYGGAFLGHYGAIGLALKLMQADTRIIDLADNAGASTGPWSGPVADGTADDGSDISLKFAAKALLKYVDTNVYSRLGVESNALINGGNGVHECQASVGNVVWDDPYIAGVINRTVAGVKAWGTDGFTFEGNNKQMPGFLFMFGGLEGTA